MPHRKNRKPHVPWLHQPQNLVRNLALRNVIVVSQLNAFRKPRRSRSKDYRGNIIGLNLIHARLNLKPFFLCDRSALAFQKRIIDYLNTRLFCLGNRLLIGMLVQNRRL